MMRGASRGHFSSRVFPSPAAEHSNDSPKTAPITYSESHSKERCKYPPGRASGGIADNFLCL
jgi:hypothetical protein